MYVMGKSIIITEAQLESILGEMAYPSNFNMDELIGITSYNGRVRYCEERLQRIGGGSSRIVFAVDNEKVLKVAKNKKGLAQNMEEGQEWKQSYGCFAKVYDGTDDGIFLEMQRANKAKKSDFVRLTGYSFEVFCAYIDYVHEWYARPSRYYFRNKEYDEIFKSEEFRAKLEDYNLFFNIQAYLCDTCLNSIGDLKRLSSWGVVKENGEENLVLIDYGLTDEIYDEYYKRY